eukprot:scaffold35527_cov49-Phaeocystis_antarctica.AAC.1
MHGNAAWMPRGAASPDPPGLGLGLGLGLAASPDPSGVQVDAVPCGRVCGGDAARVGRWLGLGLGLLLG